MVPERAYFRVGGPVTDPSRRIATVPNAISAIRIATIPIYATLIIDRGTTFVGLMLFGVVCATDWLDGYLARRTGQVTELGKLLDPIADRLAVGIGLAALLVRGAFPPWAAALVIVRDLLLLLLGAGFFVLRRVRIDVRLLGKRATFLVMLGIGGISWSSLGYPLETALGAFGWLCFVPGIVGAYAAAGLYLVDLRRALAGEC